MAKRIIVREMMKIPIDELPIEAIVVGDEERTPIAVVGDPGREVLHNGFRIVKRKRVLARKSADGECFGYPLFGDGFEFAVERLF